MARVERFVKPPHTLHVKRENRHLSVVERHLAALRLAEEEKRMVMENEQEIIAHMMDYSLDERFDDDGFPLETRYQVPDSVPDVYIPPVKKEDDSKDAPEVTPVESET